MNSKQKSSGFKILLIAMTVLLVAIGFLLLPAKAQAACSGPTGAAGDMVYNVDHKVVQYCDDTNWIGMAGGGVSGAGTGGGMTPDMIAAFPASACPAGWVEYTPARGRFLRGIDNGAGNDPDGTRAPGNLQTDLVGPHSHALRIGQGTAGSYSGWNLLTTNSYTDGSHIQSNNTSETRPKNVAVIYCKYSGGSGGGAASDSSFSVHKNGTNQSVSANTWTKLTWSTERFDASNSFTADRFTPTVAGKYIINANAQCIGASTCAVSIYKNGVSQNYTYEYGTNEFGANATTILDMNGTSDYAEAWVYNGGGTTINGQSLVTGFSGALVGGGGGGSGGGGSGTGWTDVPLSDTSNFDTQCMYRASFAGGSTVYAGSVMANYILFDISTNNMKFGSVNAATKGQWGYRDEGNTDPTYSNQGATTKVEKNCGGSGSGGSSGGSGSTGTPAMSFSVHKNAVNQTVTTNAWVKLTWPNEYFDTNNAFANDRFTVPAAGKYYVTVKTTCVSGTECYIGLAKNGSIAITNAARSASGFVQVSGIFDLAANDYMEGFVYNGGGTAVYGDQIYSTFSGYAINGGGSSSTPTSGSTVIASVPDILMCQHSGGQKSLFYHVASSSSGHSYRYIADPTGPTNVEINYTAAGAYSSHTNMTNYDCLTNAWSLSDLYTNGRAFNIVGGGGGANTMVSYGYKYWTHNATDLGHEWIGKGTNFRNCVPVEYFQTTDTVQNSWVYDIFNHVLGSNRAQWPSHAQHAKLLRDFTSSYTTADSVYYSWAKPLYGPSILSRCEVDVGTGSETASLPIGSGGSGGSSLWTANGSDIYSANSGNVGIGTTTPSTKLHVNGNITSANAVFFGNGKANLQYYNTGPYDQIELGTGTGQTTTNLAFHTNGISRMWITPYGLVGIGTYSPQAVFEISNAQNAHKQIIRGYGSGYGNGLLFYPTNDSAAAILFHNAAGTLVGSIGPNASSTVYNTTSDYRLKDDVKPMEHALDSVMRLKPSSYVFKNDRGHRQDGFLAHEIQDVVPYAVTGEKDAVDDKGKPVYQQVDYGKLTPLLAAAIQELKAENEALKAEMKDLKDKVEKLDSGK